QLDRLGRLPWARPDCTGLCHLGVRAWADERGTPRIGHLPGAGRGDPVGVGDPQRDPARAGGRWWGAVPRWRVHWPAGVAAVAVASRELSSAAALQSLARGVQPEVWLK